MQNLLRTNKFSKKYPGPFGCFANRDGVDDTFDVVCLSAGDRVIATYYWDERDHCLLVSTTVTEALNRMDGYSFADADKYSNQFQADRLDEFFQLFPGPFRVNRDFCSYYGTHFTVRCESTTESVIYRLNWGSLREARIVARHVARALNQLRKSLKPQRETASSSHGDAAEIDKSAESHSCTSTSAFSVADRSSKPRVVISVSGGLVQDVACSQDAEIIVVDWDTGLFGDDEDDVFPVPLRTGRIAQARIYPVDASVPSELVGTDLDAALTKFLHASET